MKRREFIVLGGTAAVLASTGLARAQEWPTKGGVVISAYPAGGTSDIIARLVADEMTAKLGQQFVVENHPGASGAIAGSRLARSAPDGYTIMVTGSAPLAANKVVQTNLAYDPQVDFAPITVVCESPALLSASLDAPAKSLQELLAFAKANPGQVNIGNPGAGTKGHIVAAMIGQVAGVEVNHIPYKGSAPLVADLLGSHIHYALDAPSNYLPHIQAGKIQGLAVSTSGRIPDLPEVMTVAEQGLDGFESTLWFGAVGPKDMPADIVNKVYELIKAWATSPEATEKLGALGLTPVVNTPAEMVVSIEKEIESIRPLVEAGLVQAT